MFGMIRQARMTVGRKIYALICLSFIGLLGVAFLGSRELASSLDQQKQIELQHLGELALGIVKEEHAAAQKGGVSDADAQKRAMARVAALRYGSNDYFWINDMHPKMVMHPIKPEMNGNDLSTYKDPNGKLLFVDFVNDGQEGRLGLRSLRVAQAGLRQAAAEIVLCGRLCAVELGYRHRRLHRRPEGAGLGIDPALPDRCRRGPAVHACGVDLRGAEHHRPVAAHDRHHERSCRRQPRRRGARHRTRRRDRRDGQGRRSVQEQCRRPPGAGGRAARGRDPRGREPQGGHAQDGRRFRGGGRPDRRDRVVCVQPTRGLGGHADDDRGTRAGTRDNGRGGLRGSFHQRAVGGLGHRGDGLVRQRDQPPGAGIGADGQ